jgi:hypothetical protein
MEISPLDGCRRLEAMPRETRHRSRPYGQKMQALPESIFLTTTTPLIKFPTLIAGSVYPDPHSASGHDAQIGDQKSWQLKNRHSARIILP